MMGEMLTADDCYRAMVKAEQEEASDNLSDCLAGLRAKEQRFLIYTH